MYFMNTDIKENYEKHNFHNSAKNSLIFSSELRFLSEFFIFNKTKFIPLYRC